MLTFTQKELIEHYNQLAQTERARIAAMLRKKADEHHTWEVHDLLKSMADSIEAGEGA